MGQCNIVCESDHKRIVKAPRRWLCVCKKPAIKVRFYHTHNLLESQPNHRITPEQPTSLMPIIDILIAVAISISVIVGIFRGFVKEAISIASLLVAIWAALYLGPQAGEISDNWISSRASQIWFGRALVFIIVLFVGGLLGWGVSKIVRMSALGGMDRIFGSMFGAIRGIVLVALAVIGGQFAELDGDQWWQESKLIPRLTVVAEWIKVAGPRGFEMLTPDESDDVPEIDILIDLLKPERT